MIHKFTNPKAEGGDETITTPNDWNAPHIWGRTPISVNTTLSTGNDLYEVTTGSSNIALTLPTAVGAGGAPLGVIKKDAASGTAIIGTTSSQTINGPSFGAISTYTLRDQNQFIELYSDGANWNVARMSHNEQILTPAGTINGINLIFTLAFAPTFPLRTKVYLNGVRLPAAAFSLAGLTLTFVSAPQTVGGISDVILCDVSY